MSVMEAQHYRDEVATLQNDPIIRAMAAEVCQLPDVDPQSWDFVSAASREYHARGGDNARSIGGPARAIYALLQQHATYPPGC